MIQMEVGIGTDILDDIELAARDAPKKMSREVGRVAVKINTAIRLKIMKPPPVYRGKRVWTSEKQRKYVMAMLRERGNLPYRRTGRLVNNWRVYLSRRGNAAGDLVMENKSPYARFVQGPDVQRMHRITGWPQMSEVAEQYRKPAEEMMIEAWFKVLEPPSRRRVS